MRLSLLVVSTCLIGCAGSGLRNPSGGTNPGKVLPFAIRSYNIKLSADPARERLSVHVRMKLDNGALRSKLRFLFTRPSVVNGVYVIENQKVVPLKYSFKPSPIPAAFWRTEMIVSVARPTRVMHLIFEYRYDKKSLRGYAPNPTTMDNLHLGQLTRSSIYSSHLLYYPQHTDKENGFHETARLSIDCPARWMGVSSGRLLKGIPDPAGKGRKTYTYSMAFSSGRLPYPLAVYPYQTQSINYGGRLPVTIYHAPSDGAFAAEKLRLIKTRILPFLEKRMGPFPFPELRIVEVFPWEGNTGLAARGLVMLSQKVWFAAPIKNNLTSTPAEVLVDEIAHQWNYYRVKLPNYVAEGVSQFTDMLFHEHIRGNKAYRVKVGQYLAAYGRIVRLIKVLRNLKLTKKQTLEQAATTLKLKPAVIRPFWKSADHGETAISDPNTFAALYFIKGALALHALRLKLGDRVFFDGFRRLFQSASSKELTLRDFRRPFEAASKTNLEGFMRRWYLSPGIPKQDPLVPPARR
jgi:Peptidase family M1 domain